MSWHDAQAASRAPCARAEVCRAHLVQPIGFASLVIFLLAASPALSETFVPPVGCEGFLTVQSRGCKVSNHYRCTADAPGDQWRVDFDRQGPYFESRIDDETQWVESRDLITGLRQRLSPGAADPASFTGLLQTGTDTFDFRLERQDGRRSRVRGFDMLTGRSIVVSGVQIEETSFEFRETLDDGTFLHGARGHEYINREWRLFFSGRSLWIDPEGEVQVDYSPAEFAFPGTPGFFTMRPKFDCDAQIAAAQGDEQ